MGSRDGRLWAIALAISLFGNLVLLVAALLVAVASEKLHKIAPTVSGPAAAKAETTVIISPEMIQKVTEASNSGTTPAIQTPATARLTNPEFARTSDDQAGKRPDKPLFIGERNTEATSDATPDPNAPAMPSQRGIQPKDSADFETTESRYQDGPLETPGAPAMEPETSPPSAPPAAPPVPEPAPTTPETTPAPPAEMGNEETAESKGPAELLQGHNPVDVNVAKAAPAKSLPPEEETPPPDPAAKITPEQETPTPAKPTPKPGAPGFRGYQRKTAIQGSISRTGRSAMDVVDTPLGRYQAIISRAVELEWQRNCVRHRDFITPGFLTVRFFVLPTGKVKSVQFVGQMETGEVQKGFTLNSIRDAAIPAMPKEIRAEYADEPLELIFNFYF